VRLSVPKVTRLAARLFSTLRDSNLLHLDLAKGETTMRPSLRASLSGLSLLALLALLAVNAPLGAITLSVTDGDESASLLSQGWTETSPGLWERFNLEGQKETFVSSAEGMRAVLPTLKEQAKQRFEAYLAKPTAANQRAYDEHKALVDSVVANLQSPASSRKRLEQGSDQALAPACTRTFSYGTLINTFHCVDQSYASASYSVSNATSCPEQCTVHAYSYGSLTECGVGPYTDSQSCTQTGTNVSCSTYASGTFGTFGTSCYYYAFASVHCPALNNLFLSQSSNSPACTCNC
jgi:hypothetical protein